MGRAEPVAAPDRGRLLGFARRAVFQRPRQVSLVRSAIEYPQESPSASLRLRASRGSLCVGDRYPEPYTLTCRGSPMLPQISEPDWKLFRQLHPLALERFCERVLSEVGQHTAPTDKSAHERYLAVFELLQERNDELAEAFDDFRRSTALRQLAVLRNRGLISGEELARFSPETQGAVELFLQV